MKREILLPMFSLIGVLVAAAALYWLMPSEYVDRVQWGALSYKLKAPLLHPTQPRQHRAIAAALNPGACRRVDCRETAAHIHYEMTPVRWLCVDKGDLAGKCTATFSVQVLLFNPTGRDVVFERAACVVRVRSGEELADTEQLIGRNKKNRLATRALRLFKGPSFRVAAYSMREELFGFFAGPILRGDKLHMEKPFCHATPRPDEEIITVHAPKERI